MRCVVLDDSVARVVGAGVYWHSARRKWTAKLYLNGKSRHLGYFPDAQEAARAYDRCEMGYMQSRPAS